MFDILRINILAKRVFVKSTSPKSRIALQVARKIALCDRAFSQTLLQKRYLSHQCFPVCPP